jgi:hypothetical protein
MHKQTTTFICGLALAMSPGAWTQNVQFGYSTFGPMDTKTVTGAPYSATAITTSTQTLSDGTHITRTIQAQVARDSEGRTRREESITGVGPWSTGGSEQHLVSISDPVTQAHYVLRPDQQVAMKGPAPSTVAMATPGIKLLQPAEKALVKASTAPDNVMWMAKEGTLSVAGTVMVIGGSEKNAQVEELGDQMIEGVRAHGRREKRTIAVGEIGNDRPIDVSSETWFSDELQTIVLSKRSDPRMGDSEYRLTNISRNEPAASLFEVPAGYTVKDESKRRE